MSKRRKVNGLWIAAAVAWAGLGANGDTYYVDPSGSDTHDGSLAHPFLTLQRAADVITGTALAGGLTTTVGSVGSVLVAEPQTVVVRAGSYAGFVMNWDTPVSGSTGAPIAFLAEPGAMIGNRNGKTPDGIDFEPGSAYVTISGFTILNAGTITRAGIRVCGSDHVSILNNVCGSNGYWGIFTSHADNLLVENNEAFRSVGQHGIYVSNAGIDPVVRGNRVHDNRGCGIHMNGDASNNDPGFTNWNTGLITGALVENNVVYNNGVGGGSGINMDGVQHSTVRNNVLYNNHASGIAMFQMDGAQGPKSNVIYHNTIDMASDSRWAVRLDQLAGAVTLRNNILYNRNAAHGGINFTAPADAALTDSDYNVFGGGRPAVTPDDLNTTSYTPAQWQAQGQDAHSFTETLSALFINSSGAAGADYHTATNSPAIDRGETLSSVSVDLEGGQRPVGTASDIGAYESFVLDADGDGLPDAWETLYFGGATGANAAEDNDLDGFGNLEEYLAGTDPTDGNSRLRLISGEDAGAPGFVVRWSSASNREYTIVRTTNLLMNGEGFTPLGTGIPGTPPENVYTDATAGVDNRFYRVGVVVP
ncbi:MAG: right-handed parallel beta-helix repeat-containing protein [bacterium]